MDFKNAAKNLIFWLASLAFGYWGYGMVKLFAPKSHVVVMGVASLDNAIAVAAAIVVSSLSFWLLRRRFAAASGERLAEEGAQAPPVIETKANAKAPLQAVAPGTQPRAVYHCPCGAKFVEPLVYRDFTNPDAEELVCPSCYMPQPRRQSPKLEELPATATISEQAQPAATALPATPPPPPPPAPMPAPPPEAPAPAPAPYPAPAPTPKPNEPKQVIINIYAQDAAKGAG